MKISKSFLRYSGVGVMSNGLLYVLFVVLIWVGFTPPITAAICYVLGITFSYLMNRRWSFESNAGHRQDLPRFLFSYAAGFAATMIFIVALTHWMRPEVAQIINIGLTAMVIYLCLRLTGFGKQGDAHAD
ncbi:GtrA family protein [Roseovarius sp. M141]|uniref:GtrA family protein n=1 Tax=Roseovarius sp. M141 TaxID=2583806 RepID=UPI0020CE9254|nr:GtrA family protein [Roseovarius sp. M141]MCQ0090478.1 GtrA family protein [Roseovarius sp. M141]